METVWLDTVSIFCPLRAIEQVMVRALNGVGRWALGRSPITGTGWSSIGPGGDVNIRRALKEVIADDNNVCSPLVNCNRNTGR